MSHPNNNSVNLSSDTNAAESIPLIIDLDGTLIHSDMMFESLLSAFKAAPWIVFLIPHWLSIGIANLKQELARRAEIDYSRVPLNMELVEYIKQQRGTGRTTVLATGTTKLIAHKISSQVNLFDQVIASDRTTNLTGAAKAEQLTKLFGNKQFDYAGNDKKDFAVWEKSRKAIVVGNTELEKLASQACPVDRLFTGNKPTFASALKAMRIHQWAKNALLFIPLFTAHLFTDFGLLCQVIVGFIAFGSIASATYVINDLFDLDADRAHKTKRDRPFSNGALSIKIGLMLSGVLYFFGLILAAFLPESFSLILLIYTIVTLTYSLRIKTEPGLDIITLSFLYTIRVVAGAAIIEVEASFWLLAFSIFLFLSLATVKRVSEFILAEGTNKTEIKGRGYSTADKPILLAAGIASGLISVLVFALYINSPIIATLYYTPKLLWPICLLWLYWITRVWILTSRNQMHEDPVVFALSDRTSYLIFGIIGLLLIVASN